VVVVFAGIAIGVAHSIRRIDSEHGVGGRASASAT